MAGEGPDVTTRVVPLISTSEPQADIVMEAFTLLSLLL